jgi:hypothetical protein
MVNVESIRTRLRSQADPEFAAFHRAYHKSDLNFYGLRTPELKAIFRELFPPRQPLARADVFPLIDQLRGSSWAEERSLATMLLERIQPELTARDIPYLRAWVDDCHG